jgi:hypothetical protein
MDKVVEFASQSVEALGLLFLNLYLNGRFDKLCRVVFDLFCVSLLSKSEFLELLLILIDGVGQPDL